MLLMSTAAVFGGEIRKNTRVVQKVLSLIGFLRFITGIF